MRHLVAALAVLLAVAPAAAIPPATPSTAGDPTTARASPVVADENTTEYLALPEEVEVERVASVTIDVGAAMAADNEAIYGRFGAVRLVESYRDADSAAERREVLREGAARLERRVAALRARERQARERFNAGELTATEFLRALARIDARAGKLEQAIVRLDAYNDAMQDPPLTQERVATMRARVIVLNGPVRNLIRQAMAGETTTRIHIATAEEGIALSAVVPGEGKYRREAYVLGNRRPAERDRFGGPVEAFEYLTDQLYPHAYNLSKGYGGISIRTSELTQVGIYAFSIEHRQGTLVTYLDGATRTSFYEIQRKDLSAVPTQAPVTATDEDLFVQVNRTRAGGPLEVRVRNAVSLEPVDARVSVNGQVVGRTGGDGRLWTVTPPRSVSVTATRGSANATVTTAPAP